MEAAPGDRDDRLQPRGTGIILHPRQQFGLALPGSREPDLISFRPSSSLGSGPCVWTENDSHAVDIQHDVAMLSVGPSSIGLF